MLKITQQRAHLALATVNWQLRRADGTLERAWRPYSRLRKADANWSVLMSTFQIAA